MSEKKLKKTFCFNTKQALLWIVLFLAPSLFANPIELEKYHISIETPPQFHKTSQTEKKVTLIHTDKIATINLRVYNFTEVITANEFQKRRRIGHYDGWENLLERDGNAKENKRANIQESYVAVYSKKQLDKNLVIQKLVVAEYYYIKEPQRGIVISILAKHQDWPKIKIAVRRLIDSFWVGPGNRNSMIETQNKTPYWTQLGKTPQNKGSSTSNFSFSTPPKQLWEYEVNSSTTPKMSPLITQQGIFYGQDQTLIALETPNGKTRWKFNLPTPLQSPVSYHQNRLFFTNNNSLTIAQANTGYRLHTIPFQASKFSSISISDKALALIAENTLHVFHPSTLQLLWKSTQINRNIHPIQTKHTILAIDTENYLCNFSLLSGKLLWRTKLKNSKLFPPIVHKDKIYVAYEGPLANHETSIFLHELETDSGKILWTYKSGPNFNLIGEPTLLDNAIYILVQMDIFRNPSRQKFIAIDRYSGKTKWSQSTPLPIKNHKFRPYVTNQLAFYTQATPSRNEIHAIDAITGSKFTNTPLLSYTKQHYPYHLNSIEDQLFVVEKNINTTSLKSYQVR